MSKRGRTSRPGWTRDDRLVRPGRRGPAMWWGRGRVRGRPATTWGWAKSEDLRGLHRRTRLWFRGRLRRLWV